MWVNSFSSGWLPINTMRLFILAQAIHCLPAKFIRNYFRLTLFPRRTLPQIDNIVILSHKWIKVA